MIFSSFLMFRSNQSILPSESCLSHNACTISLEETPMRFSYIAALGLILLSSSALAQTEGKPVFGRYTCRQPVPCDSFGAYTSAQWAQAGKACLTAAFDYSNTDDFFDDSAGLDDSNCLTTNLDVIPKGKATRLIPYCCVVKLPTNACVFQCKLVQE